MSGFSITDIQPSKLNLFFLFIMVVGSVVILTSFYLIDVEALVRHDSFTTKQKIMGIGIAIVVIHIFLTFLGKKIFSKLQNAKNMVKQKNEEVIKIDKAKTEFVAMVTHELRTPIVPITSYAKMLLQERFGQLNETQKEKMKIIIKGAESLQLLIQDILDVHKADLGKLKLNLELYDIRDIIVDAVADTIPLANRRGVIIQDLSPISCKIQIDKHRMVQVLTNLIKNAIDFVPLEEGVIKIQSEINGNCIVLSVNDNGQGIAEEKVGNLFKKFYQVESSDSAYRDSTGLGLAICKIIVEEHGGRIWAESSIGKGATFRVSLPLVQNSERNNIVMAEKAA